MVHGGGIFQVLVPTGVLMSALPRSLPIMLTLKFIWKHHLSTLFQAKTLFFKLREGNGVISKTLMMPGQLVGQEINI